jgi:hypothetical protein
MRMLWRRRTARPASRRACWRCCCRGEARLRSAEEGSVSADAPRKQWHRDAHSAARTQLLRRRARQAVAAGAQHESSGYRRHACMPSRSPRQRTCGGSAGDAWLQRRAHAQCAARRRCAARALPRRTVRASARGDMRRDTPRTVDPSSAGWQHEARRRRRLLRRGARRETRTGSRQRAAEWQLPCFAWLATGMSSQLSLHSPATRFLWLPCGPGSSRLEGTRESAGAPLAPPARARSPPHAAARCDVTGKATRATRVPGCSLSPQQLIAAPSAAVRPSPLRLTMRAASALVSWSRIAPCWAHICLDCLVGCVSPALSPHPGGA